MIDRYCIGRADVEIEGGEGGINTKSDLIIQSCNIANGDMLLKTVAIKAKSVDSTCVLL